MRKLAEVYHNSQFGNLEFHLSNEEVVGEEELGFAIHSLTADEKKDYVLVQMTQTEYERARKLLQEDASQQPSRGCPTHGHNLASD